MGLVTGSSVAAAALDEASDAIGAVASEYRTIDLRTRFAFTPCVSAVRATDTPGRLHSAASARLAVTLYERRPFFLCLVTKPATTSALFSDMVSTC
jgi:hypothetical protein